MTTEETLKRIDDIEKDHCHPDLPGFWDDFAWLIKSFRETLEENSKLKDALHRVAKE